MMRPASSDDENPAVGFSGTKKKKEKNLKNTDVSKQEGNVEANAFVRHCCSGARIANDI